MELRLVDIAPTPDTDANIDPGLPALEFPVVEPAPAVPRALHPPVARPTSGPGMQLVDSAPAVASVPVLQLVDDRDAPPGTASPSSQEIDLVAVGTKRTPTAVPEAIAAAAVADPVMAEALREYQNGNIDMQLWSRAIAHHDGDQSQAVAAYLKARTTVLMLERRNRRAADPAPSVQAAVPAARPVVPDRDDDDYDYELRKRQHRAQLGRKYAMVATPFVVALVIGVWWMVSTSDQDSVQASHNVAGTPAVARASAAKVPAPAPAVPVKEEDPGTYFAGKILDLKSAGNWNVLVLFASEWTRKQPRNGLAWKELSNGYANMRQYNDAIEAGTKATQLAPDDPLVWRNLAQINLDIREPAAALKAFERAAALDPSDEFSRLQVATLTTQLGRSVAVVTRK